MNQNQYLCNNKHPLHKFLTLYLSLSIYHSFIGYVFLFAMSVKELTFLTIIFRFSVNILGSSIRIPSATSKNLPSTKDIWFSLHGPCTNSIRVSIHPVMFLKVPYFSFYGFGQYAFRRLITDPIKSYEFLCS